MHRWTIGSMAAVAALVLGACGADGDDSAGGTTPDTGVPPTTGAPPEGTGGWIDGPPDWSGGGDEGAVADALGGEVAEYESDDGVSAPRDTRASAGGGDVAVPEPVEPGPLRAGSVDDNTDFDRYLEYLARVGSLGIPLRDFDPTGRIVVTATGTTGLPVAGAEVVVMADGVEVARIRTTADGTARFHPALHGAAGATSFEFTTDGVSATAEPGGSVVLDLPGDGGAASPIPIDVLFLLDATGSMGDEIDRLKTSIDSVAARIAALESAPDVRFAMTLYRDEGDSFVTVTHDFTGDVDAFRAALAGVVADGGGDYPEALDEGLAEALAAPAWRDPASTVQLIFLVADAPPQVARQVATPYPAAIADAVGRGIKIVPVASSESDDQAEAVFLQLAQATGARFVFLSYGAGGAATGGSTDIDRTDYEELALDDLVVRLVTEELAALTGDPGQVPPPASTTTTVPDGQ